MTNQDTSPDVWALPVVVLWAFFFIVGLFPQMVFLLLREAAWVQSQNALVNSPALITLGLASYLGWFAYQRCIETGMKPIDAQGRGLYVAVLGSIAFWGFPFEFFFHMPALLGWTDRAVTYLFGFAKIAAWIYLYAAVLRYHAYGNTQVFAHLLPISHAESFPYTHEDEPPSTEELQEDPDS